MSQFSPKELEEFEFRQRAEQELNAQNQPSTEFPPSENSTTDVARKIGMGGAGAAVGILSKGGGEKIATHFGKGKPAPTATVTVSGAPAVTPPASQVAAARSGLSNEISQQTRTAQRAERAKEYSQILQNLQSQGVKVNPNFLSTLPVQHALPESGILINTERALQLEAEQNAKKLAQAKAAPITQKVAQAAAPTIQKIGTYPLGRLGLGITGLGTGLQAADMLSRRERGDKLGALISGIGAVGSAASAFPHPVTRLGGMGVSIGAEGLNAFLDYLARKNRAGGANLAPSPEMTVPPPMAKGGKVDKPMSKAERAAHHLNNMKKAAGGQIAMKEGGHTTAAWQRKEGKNPEGGLNAVGRASYKRETGGTLKAPQPEGGSRKKSFCARMGGMKKKLTSSKTANDPDSRINKALRKWKC